MKQHLMPRLAALLSAAFCASGLGRLAAATECAVNVQVDKPGHRVSPLLWGLFFEEINHAGDGGLYAELVRNRSFEDADKPDRWSLATSGSARGEIAIDEGKPLNPLNRRSLRLRITEAADGKVSVVNEGYWGIAVTREARYHLSLAARCADGFKGPIQVALQGPAGNTLAETTFEGLTQDWKTFTAELTAADTQPKARLVVGAAAKGTVWLDMVSLFPMKTWKDRRNGLRPDLAGMLAGLRPSFVRFPGGCWVEGHDLKQAYRWKETIGDVSQRRNQWNLWQYYSTHGLGYLEYLILCEDLGAEPLFVINCGMSHTEVAPMDQMGQFIQDALDAIEYANGPTNSVWGALRARHGHPQPFHLKYVEIGNENGGPAYHERYAGMYQAIKARYPAINLVADEWGGVPTNAPVDIVDEHYYNTPEFFIQQAERYDRYDRRGPKIYVGEYAVTQGCGQGNLRAAVGEAAFMTGMERNSDVVIMASYAPLFVNVNYRKWNPDLIDFDSARVYGIPSYYVQQMFSQHRGDVVLPVTIELPPEGAPEPPRGRIGLGTWVTQAEYKDAQVTQGDRVLYTADFAQGASDWKAIRGQWKAEEGVYRQTSNAENVQAHAGDPGWSEYTYSLKARKLGGAEGFLVMFHVKDAQNWVWWNLGGWGNREHALELCQGGGKSILGNRVAGRIETGRWYDLRVELKGQNIKCHLDGKLVHDVSYPRVKPLYASATLAQAAKTVILKAVNVSKGELTARINLGSAARLDSSAEVILLSSASPQDENSLEQPAKVAPVTRKVDVANGSARLALPGNSVAVCRFKLQ